MDEKTLSAVIESVISELSKTGNQSTSLPDDVTLKAAKRLIEKVEQRAEEMGVRAVVAVTNRAARPVAVCCMDDSYFASYDIATGKAYTCVSLKMATSQLKPLCQPGAPLYGIQHTNGGKIVIFGGGVPLYAGEKLIGGLGVSGGSEEQDTALAEYGQSVFAQCF